MDYTTKIASHNKAIEILELLDKAVKRLRMYEDALYKYNKLSSGQRIWSFYQKSELEFDIKKGERSVSFITGMYERFMHREFKVFERFISHMDYSSFPVTKEWKTEEELSKPREIQGRGDFFELMFPGLVEPINTERVDKTDYGYSCTC